MQSIQTTRCLARKKKMMAIKTKTKATTNPILAKPPGHNVRFVLLGSKDQQVPPGVTVCRGSADLFSFVRQVPKKHTYVCYRRSSTEDLVKEIMKLRGARVGDLLTLEPPRPESIPTLSGLFRNVVGAIPGYTWLPREEIPTVLSGKDASERFIGGAADSQGKTIALIRGNLSTLVVPFAYFKMSGDGTKPDFSKLKLADYGHTVALGDYEASADGILYEFDPTYRRKLKKERLAKDATFGASLRRLRLQRGLKQSDFTPIASKTIARVERGEVEKPHGNTLEVIANRLGVAPDQIESY